MSGQKRPRVDLSFGPGHGPVSGVLNASGAAMAGTMLLELGGGYWAWGAVAGVALAVVGVVVATWYQQPGRVVAYRAGCWAAAGAWSGWTLSGFQGIPLPPVDPRLPGYAGAVAMLAVAYTYGRGERPLPHRIVCWAAVAGWTAWSLVGFRSVQFVASPLLSPLLKPTDTALFGYAWSPGTPWAWRPWIVLGTGAAIAAAAGWHIQRAEQRRAQEAAKQADVQRAAAAELAARNAKTEQEAIAFREGPIIRKITKKPIEVLNVELWEPAYGHTLDCELPDDGTTFGDVKPFEEAIASALNLPDGCGVEIVRNEGLGRRAILIKITTESALGQDIHYPADYSAETIENPVALGVLTDRQVAEVPMRYECVTLVGNTDSGKSNELNVITAGLARCTDVLLVGIDLSGNGRFLRPWVRPYHEGRASRPVFAYMATTDVQAAMLCTALIQIIDGRTADYAELMRAENTDKIMPRPALPQITLIVDEFGKLPDQVRDMVKTINDTGRGAAVRTVSCALEATIAYLPRQIITQSRVRIGMRVVDETQLQYLFDTTWRRGRIDPASLPWKGSGLYTEGAKFPDKFKGYRVEPAQVDEIAVAVADLRPDLDEASLRRGDTVTLKLTGPDGRVERTFAGVLSGNEAETYPAIFPAAVRSGGGRIGEDTTMTTPTGSSGGGPVDLGGAVRDLNAALDAARKAADDADANRAAADSGDEQEPGDPDDPTVAELNALLAMPAQEPTRPGQQPPAGPGPGRPGTPPRGRATPRRKDAAGRGGGGRGDIHATLAAEGYPTSLTTVNNWLREWAARGIVEQPGGERTPYLPGPHIDGQGRAAA